jgi:polar amino acid transport system substrate-binding protein
MKFFLPTLVVLVQLMVPVAAQSEQTNLRVISSASPYVSQVFDALTIEIFKRLDRPLTLVKLAATERAIASANEGIYDGDGLRVANIITPIYPNLIQVPESYLTLNFVGFAKNKTVKIDGWDSLENYSVGYQIGWKVVEKNLKKAKSIATVPNGESLFKMLNYERVDVIVYVDLEGIGILNELGIKGINKLEPPLLSSDMYLYLNKKHAALVPKIAETLREMKHDGGYQAIIDKVSKTPFEVQE